MVDWDDDEYLIIALINIESNKMIAVSEPFRYGITQKKNMSKQYITLTDDEQDMIFNKNKSPGIDSDCYCDDSMGTINYHIKLTTYFDNPVISMTIRPFLSDIKYKINSYEYKQIGQYFCRIPKTNKIYLDIIKDDDKYIKIWLLLMELHDIRAQIVWNMITLNRLDVDNYNAIY